VVLLTVVRLFIGTEHATGGHEARAEHGPGTEGVIQYQSKM